MPRFTTTLALSVLTAAALGSLGACSSTTSTGAVEEVATPVATGTASTARSAGAVTKKVELCIRNNSDATVEVSPSGPYGTFTSLEPTNEACFWGDNLAGDPVVALTFADDSFVFVYGRNPVIGRPDIRLCADQDCDKKYHQFDLSVGDTKEKVYNNVTYTAYRGADFGVDDVTGNKSLRLTVS